MPLVGNEKLDYSELKISNVYCFLQYCKCTRITIIIDKLNLGFTIMDVISKYQCFCIAEGGVAIKKVSVTKHESRAERVKKSFCTPFSKCGGTMSIGKANAGFE